MIYNETIVIQNNKARRILEGCKKEGIELYDSINNKSRSIMGISMNNLQKQVEKDATRVSVWSEKTRDKIEEIFLTPRLVIEFNKKNKLEEEFPTNPYGLHVVVKKALLRQIYFIEVIINDIGNYKIKRSINSNKVELEKFGLTNFNVETSK